MQLHTGGKDKEEQRASFNLAKDKKPKTRHKNKQKQES